MCRPWPLLFKANGETTLNGQARIMRGLKSKICSVDNASLLSAVSGPVSPDWLTRRRQSRGAAPKLWISGNLTTQPPSACFAFSYDRFRSTYSRICAMQHTINSIRQQIYYAKAKKAVI
uniref:Uncharacterized protein n=1 Tax=Rhizobium rhizogenes (strain K84 / ATCC BAA-868) TaxID=311403 RepID=B2Z3T2_RHIR8|nr:hypothetical protein [Rhizobium rhizogenes K84]